MRFAIKKLDSFTAVGYGNTAQLQLDTGSTYEEIVLNTEKINVNQILRVEMILNGEAIVAVSGQHLKDIDTHLG
ncbi:MAG: major capsid protein P2, partial [Xanthomonadaceae bacterium]|nr:major capsid protein P2 [Xanthomonadaceae bacterium]